MKATTLLFFFLFFANLALAQFGITGKYHLNKAPDWVPTAPQDATDPYNFLGNGWSVGLDYWLRLKNYRIEFLPELNYAQFKGESITTNSDTEPTSNRFYSFFLNTNFYLFDFVGDCNCPTFSKQGQLFKKGFFVQISPGLTYLQGKVALGNALTDEIKTFESTSLAASLGVGAGIDIGVSDFVTFTPIIGVRYFPNAKWESLSNYKGTGTFEPLSTESAIWQLSAGARLSFRFDYQSNRRRR